MHTALLVPTSIQLVTSICTKFIYRDHFSVCVKNLTLSHYLLIFPACKQIYYVFTFFNKTTPMAVWAVKRMAFIIMIAPTATLIFRAARLTIHPLRCRDKEIFLKRREKVLISSCAPGLKEQAL